MDRYHRRRLFRRDGEMEMSSLEIWLREDVSNFFVSLHLRLGANSSSAETDSPPVLYERSLDRLACAMGGKSVAACVASIQILMLKCNWR